MKSCRHAGPARRAKPLDRHRAPRCVPLQPSAWLMGFAAERGPRPRRAADVERRPSMPPRCTKRRPAPPMPGLRDWRPSFGAICIGTYVFFVLSMCLSPLLQ